MKAFENYAADPKYSRLLKGAKRGRGILYSIFRLLILLSVGFIIIYPLFYMIVTSVTSKYGFYNSTRVWIPEELSVIENYKVAFGALDYWKSLWSTFSNEIVAAVIQIASCAVAAYGFARFDFKLKKLYTPLLFMTILLPDMMLIIPRMVNFSHLDILGIFGLLNKATGVDLRPNLLNSVLAFWLPAIFGVGLRSGILIYIYIQFFKGLPKELEEAAWVDGAGPVKTFLAIAIPSSGVVILTVTVFSLIWHWNDSLLSGMYLNDNYTLAWMLANIENTLQSKYNVWFGSMAQPEAMAYLMASCVLFIAPMLIFYMIVQRGFIESIDRVGITG